MTTELAGVVATVLVRIAFAFLPVSLVSFSFNEHQLIEAKEAINASASRILLITWWPTTLAVSSAIAATKGRDTIRFLPFVAALAACALAFWIVWYRIPLRWLRSNRSAILIAISLSCCDLANFTLIQGRIVDFFLSSSVKTDVTTGGSATKATPADAGVD